MSCAAESQSLTSPPHANFAIVNTFLALGHVGMKLSEIQARCLSSEPPTRWVFDHLRWQHKDDQLDTSVVDGDRVCEWLGQTPSPTVSYRCCVTSSIRTENYNVAGPPSTKPSLARIRTISPEKAQARHPSGRHHHTGRQL